MTTVGILGGGQLARMMAVAGVPLGLRFLVLDSAEDACAAQFAPLLRADYRDADGLAEFARRVDVATFDFENVPAESAQWLAARSRGLCRFRLVPAVRQADRQCHEAARG